jgi:hypothetical protein
MKTMLFLIPVAAIVASAAMAAPAGGGFGDQQFVVPQSMNDPQVRKANALHDWRVEELKLQTADGGALTPQHRKYLQARLAAIRAGEY